MGEILNRGNSVAIRLTPVRPHEQAYLHSDGFKFTVMAGTMKCGGTVWVPAREIQMGAFYTFECEEDGKLYRWVGQQARILDESGIVRFDLPDAEPVTA